MRLHRPNIFRGYYARLLFSSHQGGIPDRLPRCSRCGHLGSGRPEATVHGIPRSPSSPAARRRSKGNQRFPAHDRLVQHLHQFRDRGSVEDEISWVDGQSGQRCHIVGATNTSVEVIYARNHWSSGRLFNIRGAVHASDFRQCVDRLTRSLPTQRACRRIRGPAGQCALP